MIILREKCLSATLRITPMLENDPLKGDITGQVAVKSFNR